MRRCLLLVIVVLLLAVGGAGPVTAQDSTGAVPDTTEPWYEGAWTHIVTEQGVHFAYLFYREADNENDGVVLRLRNDNDVGVRYSFTVIFRGPNAEDTARAEGVLEPGEMKTGDDAGLFWVPFTEGRRLGEVGLRGIEVTSLPDRRG